VRPSSSLRPKLLLLPSTLLCCGRGDEEHLSGGNCARACLLLQCVEAKELDLSSDVNGFDMAVL
jgi:hypothetical protein